MLFSDAYDVIIYVDGFQVPDVAHENVWRNMVDNMETAIIQAPHDVNKCIYAEHNAIVHARKDTREKMQAVTQYIRSTTFPANYGMFWNGCYIFNVKKHDKNSELRTQCVLEVWARLWRDMLVYTYRDQSLLMFEIWKHKVSQGVWGKAPLNKLVKMVDSNRNHVYI